MAQKITDPAVFLRNLVARKGHSDLEGVYLTAVKVSADACTDYGYEPTVSERQREVLSLLSREENKWNKLLVDVRMYGNELCHPITFTLQSEQVTVFFLSEDHEISCLVFIPKLEVSDFASEVTFYQALLRWVAQFSGKNPNTLQFTIGAACIAWTDMVDQGDAREVDVGF